MIDLNLRDTIDERGIITPQLLLRLFQLFDKQIRSINIFLVCSSEICQLILHSVELAHISLRTFGKCIMKLTLPYLIVVAAETIFAIAFELFFTINFIS